MRKKESDIFIFKLDKKNIIREIKYYEINKIKEKYRLDLFFKIKRFVKVSLTKIIKTIFFKSNESILKSRSLENVEKKYNQISGEYIKNYINKKSSFIAEINQNKIVELKGTYEKYYSKFLYNFYKQKKINSILEVGAGELTLIAELLCKFKSKKKIKKAALDISFPRLNEGRKFLNKKSINLDYIVRGDAANLPFADNSFDFIYTSHCLEQVPHLFSDIVKECVRVARKYVIFIEPSYEFGSDVTKDHIYKKGYPKISNKLFKQDTYKIVLRKGLPIRSYVNGTEIIILKKNNKKKKPPKNIYLCPSCKELLNTNKKRLICQKEKIFYAIKSNIALLEKNDGHPF